MINAVFNFRNFWDGRANNMFNGGDPFGLRNPNTFIWQTVAGVLQQVAVAIPSSSVKYQKAPFDHPSICVANGHEQDAAGKLVADATDALKANELPYRCIAAVGASGATLPLTPFLGLDPYAR